MSEIFKEPQQFIKQDADGKFEVVEAILQQIENIQKPVRAITVAGPYRNGKSYFATRLALYPGSGKPQQLPGARGFPLGCKVTAETKGIWVWAIDDPVNPGHCALILDTEGLGDVKKIKTDADKRLLTLVTLISDTLCYNMKAPLDATNLNQLKLISDTAKSILKEQSNSDAIKKMLPKFVLLLRDSDQFDEPDGDYLEDVLNEAKEEDDIRTKFTSRKCFFLPQPTSSEKFKELENLNDSELKENFLVKVRNVCDYVYGFQRKNVADADKTYGRAWCASLEEFIKVINNKGVPDVMNTMTVAKCVDAYCDKMNKMLGNQTWWKKMKIQFNYKSSEIWQEVKKQHDDHKNQCIKTFADKLRLDSKEECNKCLEIALDRHYKHYEERIKSDARWTALLSGVGIVAVAAISVAGYKCLPPPACIKAAEVAVECSGIVSDPLLIEKAIETGETVRKVKEAHDAAVAISQISNTTVDISSMLNALPEPTGAANVMNLVSS